MLDQVTYSKPIMLPMVKKYILKNMLLKMLMTWMAHGTGCTLVIPLMNKKPSLMLNLEEVELKNIMNGTNLFITMMLKK